MDKCTSCVQTRLAPTLASPGSASRRNTNGKCLLLHIKTTLKHAKLTFYIYRFCLGKKWILQRTYPSGTPWSVTLLPVLWGARSFSLARIRAAHRFTACMPSYLKQLDKIHGARDLLPSKRLIMLIKSKSLVFHVAVSGTPRTTSISPKSNTSSSTSAVICGAWKWA